MAKIKMGDRVTTRDRVEASHSGSDGNPICFFEPGEVGVVQSIDTLTKAFATQFSVLFYKEGIIQYSPHADCWLVSLDFGNIVVLPLSQEPYIHDEHPTQIRSGDLITCRTRVRARNDRFVDQPECFFEPDTVGIVNTRYVSSKTYPPTLSSVEARFYKEGEIYQSGNPWRVRLDPNNVIVLLPMPVNSGISPQNDE